MSEKYTWYTRADDPTKALINALKGGKGVVGSTAFKVTVEAIAPEPAEEPEEPQWWMHGQGGWSEAASPGVGFREYDGTCVVYGTTADRDAKRDALLAAARAAGKDGEE